MERESFEDEVGDRRAARVLQVDAAGIRQHRRRRPLFYSVAHGNPNPNQTFLEVRLNCYPTHPLYLSLCVYALAV